MGAALVVVGVVDDEPVGLAGVEHVPKVSLLGLSHRQCGRFEVAETLGDGRGVKVAVKPDQPGCRTGADTALCLVQVHRDLEVAVAERPGELVALRCRVSAVEQAIAHLPQAAQDA